MFGLSVLLEEGRSFCDLYTHTHTKVQITANDLVGGEEVGERVEVKGGKWCGC